MIATVAAQEATTATTYGQLKKKRALRFRWRPEGLEIDPGYGGAETTTISKLLVMSYVNFTIAAYCS
jgi:hypothetical protein